MVEKIKKINRIKMKRKFFKETMDRLLFKLYRRDELSIKAARKLRKKVALL